MLAVGVAFTLTRYDFFDQLPKIARGASSQLAPRRFIGNSSPASRRLSGDVLRAWRFAAAPSQQATTLQLIPSLLTTYVACALVYQEPWTSRLWKAHPP